MLRMCTIDGLFPLNCLVSFIQQSLYSIYNNYIVCINIKLKLKNCVRREYEIEK